MTTLTATMATALHPEYDAEDEAIAYTAASAIADWLCGSNAHDIATHAVTSRTNHPATRGNLTPTIIARTVRASLGYATDPDSDATLRDTLRDTLHNHGLDHGPAIVERLLTGLSTWLTDPTVAATTDQAARLAQDPTSAALGSLATSVITDIPHAA